MPSPQKRKVLEKTRKRQNRGVLYLVIAIVLIAIVAGGVYAYISSLPPPPPDTIYATFNTSLGTFEVALFHSQTPATVNNFVTLARSGFYNNLYWWRVAPGFVIQTGDANAKSGGGSNSTWGTYQGTTIPDEIVSSLHNYAGYLAMAKTSAPNSGSTQFFINLADGNSAQLDGTYTVFGHVISGMNVVTATGNVPVYPTPPGGVCCQTKPPNPFITSIAISNSP